MPKNLSKNIKKQAKRRGCSRSELIAAALEQHLWLEQWKSLETYGFEKSLELGLEPDDVERLIDEYRKASDGSALR